MSKIIFFLLLSLSFSKDTYLTEHSLAVYGNASMGYYYVKIFVGHPTQQQSVIIDTGSGQLALPCNKCIGCNPKHIDRPFDLTKSKTAEYVTCQSNESQCKRCISKNPTEPCRFMISYAEGSSLEGIIIKDSIQFQSFSEGEEIMTSFGCTTRQTNLFLKQQANGIFGLSPQRTSTLLEDMHRKHHEFSGEQLKFTLCLAHNGGYMSVGRVNEALHKSNKSVKVSFSSHRNVYSLNDVGNIKLGNTIIHKKDQSLGTYGLFVDSGSTFTYFPQQKFRVFKKQILANCAAQKQICQIASGQSVLCFHLKGQTDITETTEFIFNPIILELGNQQIQWKASKYFLLRDMRNRQICLGVQGLDRYLLGANWMVDKDIVFNLREKTIQIFSEANCLNKQNQVRRMSQFTEQVEGHKPLTYESIVDHIVDSVKDYYLIIILGVILLLTGVVGIIIIVWKKFERKNKRKHKPINTIQTEDQIQLGSLSTNNSRLE